METSGPGGKRGREWRYLNGKGYGDYVGGCIQKYGSNPSGSVVYSVDSKTDYWIDDETRESADFHAEMERKLKMDW